MANNRHNSNKTRVNEDIRAREVRMILPEADDHEIVPTKQALEEAYKRGLDLVEVAPNARPPVCKVMDYGKFVYEKKKKEKEAKKKQHTVQVKELRFRPHTDDHDFEFKLRHARKFLSEGNKVKATVQFRGRDIIYSDQGKELLHKLADELDDLGSIETRPKLEGKRMHMMITADKK